MPELSSDAGAASLRTVASAARTATGTEFFVSLAESLSAVLEADLVLVSQLTGPPANRLQTIAAAAHGRAVEPSECAFDDAPWPADGFNGVRRSTGASTEYGALHPRLRDIRIEESAAIALHSAAGVMIGVIAVFNRQPLEDFKTAAAMLTILGAAGSAELERMRAETGNVALVAELGSRIRALTLLHQVARTLQHENQTPVAEWLQSIASMLAELWPSLDVVGARIRLGPFEFSTACQEEAPDLDRAPFIVSDGRSGSIEVLYRKGRHTGLHQADQDRALLELVADMVRSSIDARLALVALRQSEHRYRSLVENQTDMVCRYTPDTTLTFVNDAYCRYFDKPREDLLGRSFLELIPEADRTAALGYIKSLVDGRQPAIYEHSAYLPNGSIGRLQWIDQALFASDGTVEEFVGIGRDITDRWQMEQTLREKEASLREAYGRIRHLAHRLILAQEAERTEIARELHDDVNQQLAAVTIGLTLIEGRVSDRKDLEEELARLRSLATGITEKIRSLSHALHPGVLKHAGLGAAVAAHCEAVAAQHGIDVTLKTSGSFEGATSDATLCLYRVVQQALRNVVMHAGARHVNVRLARHMDRLTLTITDDGCGFDPIAERARGGLGLISMEERVHLANGRFTLSSAPGQGTRMAIELPIGE
ncbi:MAG TPA: PAS domain-containing sensor histidine kinase [Vicinamibacterales bacterium]|nr:PAS domain-containing sensor histidine kinase [Vicinamibacterales bacterium]